MKKKVKPKPKKKAKKSYAAIVPPPAPPPPVVASPMPRVSKVYLVQLKLTFTEYDLLQRFTRKHGFDSRSAYIRAGLGKMFVQHCMTKEEDKKIEQERRWHAPRRSHAGATNVDRGW